MDFQSEFPAVREWSSQIRYPSSWHSYAAVRIAAALMLVGATSICMAQHAMMVSTAVEATSLSTKPTSLTFSEQPGTPHPEFLNWARRSLVPLSTSRPQMDWTASQRLGDMIGNARIVTLGEGTHLAAEPLEFRNQLFEYLVANRGFTAIAIESGLVEGHRVYEYVRGGNDDIGAVMTQGFSWTFGRLPQNEALVRWLRAYNADPHHARKVNFYGFDLPGSPGNANASRGVDTALKEALAYLDRVDREAALDFHKRIDGLASVISVDLDRPEKKDSYPRLSSLQRDSLTACIADLVGLLERRESQYTAASTHAEYEWAYRAAIGARQVDTWLRQMPMQWQPLTDQQISFISASDDVRDRAQADNLDWILRQEGEQGRLLIFAHSVHLSAAPVSVDWLVATGNGSDRAVHLEKFRYEVAGTYLRRRFGHDLVGIGNVVGGGEIGCTGVRQSVGHASVNSIAGVLGEVSRQAYLLDMRSAPDSAEGWLDRDRPLGQTEEAFGAEYRFDLPIRRAFDIIFYDDRVAPAC